MNEVCPSCGAFTDYLGEFTGWCRECEGILGVTISKPCAGCAEWKPLDAYGPHKTTKDRHRGTCRVCETDRRRKWRLANVEHERETWRRSYARRASARPIPTMGT